MINLNITFEYVHHLSYILTWGYPTGVWEDRYDVVHLI